MKKKILLKKIIFIFLTIIIFLIPFLWPSLQKISTGLSLISGIIFAVIFENPFPVFTKKYTSKLLTYSIVGLGFGMNLLSVVEAGMDGFIYICVGIFATISFGLLLGKLLGNSKKCSLLVTTGTAICGGSAIAAVGPVIAAREEEISLSLAVIFFLNAIALFVFPYLGHYLHLSQKEFGLFSALAIHDTSSVVGATMQYGHEALKYGTTIKLTRALWIVPITFFISQFYTKSIISKKDNNKINFPAKKPWFILWFLVAAGISTYIPQIKLYTHALYFLAEKVLILIMFFIGVNLSKSSFKNVGNRLIIQGVFLWVFNIVVTLFIIFMTKR